MSSVNEVPSLSGVSDEDLVAGLKRLVEKEQICLHRIIVHLAEVERRRLFAELGYSSMFDYVTRGLGYSNASAQRRICAARAVKAVPEVFGLLEQGRISFKVLEVAGEALSKPNGKDLLLELCGRTKDEALRIVARYFPVEPKKLFDSIVPVVVKSPVSDLPLFADKNLMFARNVFRDRVVEEAIAARKPDSCGIPVPNNSREQFVDEAEWFMFG